MMDMHEWTPYFISLFCGLSICSWMLLSDEGISQSIGGGLMIGSALFLFVGFFARPKYEYGRQSIIFNAMRVGEKIRELDEPPHHKQVLAQRVLAGIEEPPTRPRLLRMTKDELTEFADGMGVDSSGTKEEIAARLHHIGEDG